MVPASKTVIAITPISKTAAATATGEFIDTKGFDYAQISVFAGTADVVSNTLSVLKIEEGDTTSSFATFAGAVSGTDYTIATNAYTSTSAGQNVWSFGVDLKVRKRYLRVSASPQATMVIGGAAVLSRAEKMPVSAADAGVLNAIYV
jgi:sugar (pentulose or hexulose) kinase